MQIDTNGRLADERRDRLRRSALPGPQQVRQQEQHEQKLRDMQDQVAQGKLVIRQMTAEERKRYPRREPNGSPKRSHRR